MNLKSIYSALCSAFAAVVVAGTVGGCFSERVAGAAPADATELCGGGAPNTVLIRNFSFGGELRVRAGTRVVFANCDAMTHSATSDTDVWDSGLIAPNTTFERVFDQPGRFPFHCEPHPSMTGAIVVE